MRPSKQIKKRGLLILAPTGSGKSTWIESFEKGYNVVKLEDNTKKWIDGDSLLEKLKIKNRNYYWYDDKSERERVAIINAFQPSLNEGKNILYSGNPLLMDADLLVIPDTNKRWSQLMKRKDEGGWAPTEEQFIREETAYNEASKHTETIWGNLTKLSAQISD